MKLTEVFKKEGLLLSFEVFPPKKEANFDSVKEATEKIAALRPDFMRPRISSIIRTVSAYPKENGYT